VPDEKFDLIVSNPPYIDDHDPHLDNLKYEPLEALTSGSNGLDDIRIIINESPKYLKEGGYLLLEHGFNQQKEIIELLKESFFSINTYKDLNDIDRAVLAQYK
jgi:release factor glutamine methyltransferase